MSHPRIILASRSPARRALMKELGIPFECHSSDYPEDMTLKKSIPDLAIHLALGKAEYIAKKFPESIIIGADTFIVAHGQKIGKPESIEDAKRIIKLMSDSVILVISGIATIQTDKDGNIVKGLVGHVNTHLKIMKLSEKDIKLLAEQENALQISGAFSIEGEGGKFVEKIEGDYNNVIGLPLIQLREMLEKLGVKLPN
jgi:septum formation protein